MDKNSNKTILVDYASPGALAGVVTVRLNRPAARNAFDPQMIGELRSVFTNVLNRDASLRTVVLRGEGASFCAGADLAWMQSMAKYDFAENLRDSDDLYAMFLALRACPVPLIGVVHGHAMGGALGLVAACDIVFAESAAQFCFSEVKLGLVPAVISPFVLEKTTLAFASRQMLTAEPFGAVEACRAGLVAQIAANHAGLDALVAQACTAIAQNGPEAVRATKALLRQVALSPLQRTSVESDEIRRLTTQVIAERRVGPEAQARLLTFFKRSGGGQ